MRIWLLGLCAVLSVACTATPDPTAVEPASSAADSTAEPTIQADDVVDLTLYFRKGEGQGAYLVPVTREVSTDADLAWTALELLIAGPVEEDGADLAAPLPTSTTVQGVRIAKGTAHVDLSRELITDADQANPVAEHEALALAAVAGTLTQLPAIQQVRLSVDGRHAGEHGGMNVGAFWGGWGLPEVLVNDDSVLSEPVEGEGGVPDLARFSAEPQHVGASTDDPVTVTSVRIRDRTTYLRVVVELEHVEEPDSSAPVPPAGAALVGDTIVLEIDGVSGYDADFAQGQRLEFDDPPFHGVSVEETEREGLVRVVVLADGPRDFWLHNLSGPTRIVLDVRKHVLTDE